MGSGPEIEFVMVGIGLAVSYLYEICTGGELSCWGIVLVGNHLGGICRVGRCSKHSKLLNVFHTYSIINQVTL